MIQVPHSYPDCRCSGPDPAPGAGTGEIPPVLVERTRRPELGDYSTSICLRVARRPACLRWTWPGGLSLHYRRSRSSAAPSPPTPATSTSGWMTAGWRSRWTSSWRLGSPSGASPSARGSGFRWSSSAPTPPAPSPSGSARNAVLGDGLASVLQAAGYQVEREYYVNDAGSQVRRFGESVFARYAQALGEDVPFPEDGYHGRYVTELGERLAAEAGRRYLEMERRQAVRGRRLGRRPDAGTHPPGPGRPGGPL